VCPSAHMDSAGISEVKNAWIYISTHPYVFMASCLIKQRIYKTVILPLVLYGCETWFLTLGEEHRLRVF
jgi:hypothetical protein